MMMDFRDLVRKYNLKIDGVLHVGAHLAEEAETYHRFRVGDVWWVEANPAVLGKIEHNIARYPKQRLIEALVFSDDGVEMPFNVTNYDGMSSSIYQFGTHTGFSPDIRFVQKIRLSSKKIDTLVKANDIKANFLNLDLQGAEGPALRGASEFLSQVDFVMTEVNKDEVYIGCTKVEEIDEILSDFQRVETLWVGDQGWGDALYLRTSPTVENYS